MQLVKFYATHFCTLIFFVLSGCGVEKRDPRHVENLSLSPISDSAKPTTTKDTKEMATLFKDLGPLYMTSGEWVAETKKKPWSAWWFPLKDKQLFESKNGLSPLEKYDQYVKKTHFQNSNATMFEKDNLYKPTAGNWEGLCHAWAMASILENEPITDITTSGISFSIFDQKALLSKKYEDYFTTYYGQPSLNEGVFFWENIRPHLFHRFVFSQLIERQRPFIMNKVPGMEVWNVPVWKMLSEVREDIKDKNLFHVKTALVATAMYDQPDESNHSKFETNWYYYEINTELTEDGRRIAIGGKWTGMSVDTHPSILIVVPEGPFVHRSKNIEIRNEWVDEILSASTQIPNPFHILLQ